MVFNKEGRAVLAVECKAPEEKLNEKVFEQIARYNQRLNVDFLWITNGAENYCCSIKSGIKVLDHIPNYEEVNRN